ncbi:zinc finger and BTB domain-containing protein 24 [Armigeres subalbatus]|uniref:zinc finger and BTB domain-containing protein 24 n=1 Tax=Armigeres subalbatus TaxID=124917 RepID=UPI002ED3C900
MFENKVYVVGQMGSQQYEIPKSVDIGVPIMNFGNMSLLTPTTPGTFKDPVYFGESCPNSKVFYGEKMKCSFSPASSSHSSYGDNNADVNNESPMVDSSESSIDNYNHQSCMMQQKNEDLYFKFDPEYIEKMQSSVCLSPATTIGTPLTSNSIVNSEYYNFNDVNCQSKNQSPCSSPPLDPWITTSLSMNFSNPPNMKRSNSPKHSNVELQPALQQLPSIKSAFGNVIQFDDGSKNFGLQSSHANYMIDYFDTSFLDQFSQNVEISGDTAQPNNIKDAYKHPEENYNTTQSTEKPNREFKDIWHQQQPNENVGTVSIKQEAHEDDDELEDDSDRVLECLWTDCNQKFPDQGTLVAHIEKTHVEVKKGEEFACFWLDCPRRYRPFNARYKLLIHMRVHSGEKPNKCPFSGCEKAFSRLENLKIHQRSHTGERPYNCQYFGCTKAFSNSSDRAKHQRTHYDTKPYACQLPGCSKRYTDPSSLRKHVKNHACRTEGHGRRKSHKESTVSHGSAVSGSTIDSLRRHSESSINAHSEIPVTPSQVDTSGDNAFEFDEVFADAATQLVSDNAEYNSTSCPTTHALNFNDMSSCFIRMMQPENVPRSEGKSCQDEFISYECVKNFLSDESYLNEYPMDDSAINIDIDQTQKVIPPFEYDFFNSVV